MLRLVEPIASSQEMREMRSRKIVFLRAAIAMSGDRDKMTCKRDSTSFVFTTFFCVGEMVYLLL